MDVFDEVDVKAAVVSRHSFADLMASDKIVYVAFHMAVLQGDGYLYLCWLIVMMYHLNMTKDRTNMYGD